MRVAVLPEVILHFGIPAYYRATLGSMEELGSMKTQRAAVTVFQQGAAIQLDAKGMGGIVDDFDSVTIGDGLNPNHVAWIAIDMRRQDGACLIGNRRLEVPPVFRLPRGGVYATSFSFC